MLHNPRLISQRHLSSFRIAFAAEDWLLMSAMPGISLTVQALLFHSWFKTPCFCLQWLFTYSSVDHCHSLLFLFFFSSSLFLFACPLHCLCLLWANEELESSSCHSSRPFISKLGIWLICCASGHQSDIDVNQKQY